MPVKKVEYCYTTVKAGRAGEAAAALAALRKAGVNLLAFTGFPTRGGKAQLDFVADDLAGVRRVAREAGLEALRAEEGVPRAGGDAVGAAHAQLKKLAKAGHQRHRGRRRHRGPRALGDDPLGEAEGLRARRARTGCALDARARQVGGAERDRTANLCVANAALSQLSYGPGTVGSPTVGSRAGGRQMPVIAALSRGLSPRERRGSL